MKVIFILGSGHCGSTLLDMILSSHSKIFSVGELDNLNFENKCTCLKKIKDCEYWKSFFDEIDIKKLKIHRKKKDFILNKNRFFYDETNSLVNNKEYVELHENIFSQLIKNSNKEIIIDSSKNSDKVELLCKSNIIEPIIIHIVRDGRGVTWSYYKKYNKILRFMFRWFLNNLKIEFLKKRLNIPYIYINYKKFVQNPNKETENILNLLKLEHEKSILNFSKFEHHQVNGNRMRFNVSSEIKNDNKWEHKMSLLYKLIFNILFGWMNFYYSKIK